ncbi:MAG: TolC family protein [Cyclobacteriaceae bacterium]
MRTLLTRFFVAMFLVGLATIASAQSRLNQYVDEALENNLVVQQKQIGLDKAMASLRIAKGMFMPSVSVLGSYTSGEGGRNIAIPVGDLLNPVYTALNQLTESNAFPQIENANENFFPNNFYDVKVRTSVPILNSDLIYNQKLRQQQVVMQEFEQIIYKRELVKEIKVAYFNYLSANEAIAIYRAALDRAAEGKRVNESLLANGKGLPAYVLRSQSEIENIAAQLLASEKQAENAKMYFNFLLNRNQDAVIESDSTIQLPAIEKALQQEGQREELKQLQEAVSINETILQMNKLNWSPKLSGFLDLGSQYQNWEFSQQARYYLFGVQLEVPLFAGFTNRNRVRQSKLDVAHAQLNHHLLSRQIDMGERSARNNLVVAYQDFNSANAQFASAASYQRLIDKGYKEGVNTFIETIDARTQLTSAQLQVNITRYRALIAHAQLERAAATYSFTHQ